MTNIYQACLDADVETDHYESDLYIPVNDLTKSIVERYEFKSNVSTFVNNEGGKLWYHIPFAYEPFWAATLKELKISR